MELPKQHMFFRDSGCISHREMFSLSVWNNEKTRERERKFDSLCTYSVYSKQMTELNPSYIKIFREYFLMWHWHSILYSIDSASGEKTKTWPRPALWSSLSQAWPNSGYRAPKPCSKRTPSAWYSSRRLGPKDLRGLRDHNLRITQPDPDPGAIWRQLWSHT